MDAGRKRAAPEGANGAGAGAGGGAKRARGEQLRGLSCLLASLWKGLVRTLYLPVVRIWWSPRL